MEKPKVIALDLDDTIANFQRSPLYPGPFDHDRDIPRMYEVGFFKNLPVIPGALFGVRALIRMGYDVHILTQPIAESAHSYSEKVQWVGLHFPELIKKVHMTQEKGMFRADYLIDDNAFKWRDKWEAAGQKFVHFYNPPSGDPHGNPVDLRKQWEEIVKFFQKEKDGIPY